MPRGTPPVGRPRASSRESIAEAACELFLEQGYERTSIAEITRRAGVGRSSFFNYFDSKEAVLWAGVDKCLIRMEAALAADACADPAASIRRAVLSAFDGFRPDNLALAIVNAAAMGLDHELPRASAARRARIAEAVQHRFEQAGWEQIPAGVVAGAVGAAVTVAIAAWARRGAASTDLDSLLTAALTVALSIPPRSTSLP